MAKNGTGSKATKRGGAQPDAQIERANSTSAMFLGGAGNRGYSWMNPTGDHNWRPRSIPSTIPASSAREAPAEKGGNAVQAGTSIDQDSRQIHAQQNVLYLI